LVEDCKMVIDDTDEYRHSQNRIQQFIEEKIIFNPTGEDKNVRKKDLSEELKIWYDVTLGIKTSRPKELFDELSSKGIECINDVFVGIQCRRHYDVTEIGIIQTKEEQFVEKFNQFYEVTHNTNDFILTTSLEEWAKDLKLKIHSSKIINEVLQNNVKLPKENRKQKKVEVVGSPEKLPKYVWIGIKKRDIPVDVAVENITLEINDVSITDNILVQSTPIVKGGASIKVTPTVDDNGCAGCGIEFVCICDNPVYKTHKVEKQLLCMNCKGWKCRCVEDELFEVEINGNCYCTTNETDGFIFDVINGEMGGEVGKFKNSIPTFYNKNLNK